VLDGPDLLVRDQDVRVLEDGLHALGVGDHVGRQVALVELHALGELELEPEGLAFLDVDDAVLADLLDRVRDHVADLALARRDGGDPGDVLLAVDLLGLALEVLDDGVDGRLDAALERHRVRAGGDVLQALADDRLSEQRRRRGAVTGDVVRRGRDLADELRALVLEDVLDLDLTSDRDAVVGDRRRAELLVQHDVASLRAKGDLDRVGEDVHAPLERAARVLVELQLLVSHSASSLVVTQRRPRPPGCPGALALPRCPLSTYFVTLLGTLGWRVPGDFIGTQAGRATVCENDAWLCYKPPVKREFSAGGVLVRKLRGDWMVAGIRPAGKKPGGGARPKGKIGQGEHPRETARREVHEETGATGRLVDKLGDVRYVYTWDGERIFKVVSFFLLRYSSGRLGDLPPATAHEV